MGGDEKVKRHRDLGKLTVRDRIAGLLDPGSFHEIGALTGRGTYDESGELTDVTPANFVMGRGRIDGRTVVVGGDDFTVRGGAADAAIFQKQVHAERMAHDLGLPIVRLVDGSGGGGSVKTLETERRVVRAVQPGLGVGGRQPEPCARRQPVPRVGRRARRGPGRDEPLLVDGQGDEPPLRGRARGREPARRGDRRQGVARREQHPHPQRHRRRRGRDRARGVRARPPVPLVPAELGRRAPAARRGRTTTRSGATTALLDAIPRDRRTVYKVRSIIDAVVDQRFVPRDRPALGPLRGHRPRAPRRLAGRGARERPVPLRGWLDGRRVAQGRALRRPGRDVPASGGPSRRQPRLRDRHRRASRPARSATAPGRSPRSTRRRFRGAR